MPKRNVKEIAGAAIIAAKEENNVEQVIDDLKLFGAVLETNPDLIALLQDGMLDLDKRREALVKTAGTSFHKFAINAISLLILDNLLNEYPSFLQALESQSRDLAKHFECNLVSAIEIDETTINKIKQILEKKWNGTVRIQPKVDPQIIGGLIIKCGDWQFQSTIQSKLQQLHNHLAFTE